MKNSKKKEIKTKTNGGASSTYAAKIKIIGIGGGGGNAVSRMVDKLAVRNTEFIAINTDAQDLDYCLAKRKLLIGKNITRGLGTGMNPELGRQAAEESRGDIVEAVKGADLVFITAGLGGGTGSSVSPLVAEIAKENGALTIAVVTKPFSFEGSQRMRVAQEALIKLKDKVDTLIVIPNDRIFSIIRKDTPLMKAFEYVDDVLRSGVQGIAELIAIPGIINLDFADIKTIMKDAGPALVGIGVGSGPDRAVNSVNQVINSPLLEVSIDGAKGVLFGVAGNRDLKMIEINEIAKVIAQAVDPAAKIIFGAYYDRKLRPGQLKVTLIATGFSGQFIRAETVPTLFNEATKMADAQKPIAKENGEKSGKKDILRKKENDESLWEIPTFLRKKK